METKNNEEVIRKACISANPEIVELKFGCEVELELEGDEAKLYDCNTFVILSRFSPTAKSWNVYSVDMGEELPCMYRENEKKIS